MQIDVKIGWFDPWVRNYPWRRAGQHTPVFLPGEFHGQRSLAGYSPWVAKTWTQLSHEHLCTLVLKQIYKNNLFFLVIKLTKNLKLTF